MKPAIFSKYTICVSVIVFIVSFTQCRQKTKQGAAVVIKEVLLDSIPSGSGIEFYHDSLYIIGDDARFLYQYHPKTGQYKTLAVSLAAGVSNRIDRNSKPDYESGVILHFRGGDYLFAFGSGSSAPFRDSLLIINLKDFRVDTILNIKRFYDHLRSLTNTAVADWNLEGAAIVKDKMILFNRGNNFLFSFDMEAFVEYVLIPGIPAPQVRHAKAKLPTIENYEARLSGAASFSDKIFFSASVEKTTDWRSDGPILGSYIGIMDESADIPLSALLTNAAGVPVKDKIESITYIGKSTEGNMLLYAVADNDDGKSKLLQIELRDL